CGFFFQAEDGIRDFHVTGVQTCALPIFEVAVDGRRRGVTDAVVAAGIETLQQPTDLLARIGAETVEIGVPVRRQRRERTDIIVRSEERRVGKGWGYRMLAAQVNRCARLR